MCVGWNGQCNRKSVSYTHLDVYKRQEEKKALRKKKKQVRELEGYRDKLIEYDNHLDTLGERNSYSRTCLLYTSRCV